MSKEHKYREELRYLFHKYDLDKSGTIDLKEIKLLLKDSFGEYLNKAKDSESAYNLEMMLESLCNELFEELNLFKISTEMNFQEFSFFMDKSMEKSQKLKKFLDTVL